ncbi:hypothetical protein [Hydrogenophaga sp. 5NK40-0174]|uniref:hypothetical protein n=1 Tax=Hydrogenophaga sp. 5NK40-0174 TaxID=3127649 RepID=UPI00333ECDB2
MKTFIRIAEVWVPTADGASLELSSGLFPDARAFEVMTRQMIFARGEGLPGRSWDQGHPIMMRELSGTYFKRAAAARAIDLTCAVALPVFQDRQLRCVVVLLMGGALSSIGTVELWHNDARIGPDLSLAEGYFGSSPKAAELEALTRDGWLPRGTGIPGLAWQKGQAICVSDVAESRHFLRKELAQAIGIGRAMAMPCSPKGTDTWVFSLLSAEETPVALRTEVWRKHTSSKNKLTLSGGFCEQQGHLADGTTHSIEAPSPIAEAWRTAVAQAQFLTEDKAPAPGIASVLAMPVLVDDVLEEVVALYF